MSLSKLTDGSPQLSDSTFDRSTGTVLTGTHVRLCPDSE